MLVRCRRTGGGGLLASALLFAPASQAFLQKAKACFDKYKPDDAEEVSAWEVKVCVCVCVCVFKWVSLE